jgi:hypothetical protein
MALADFSTWIILTGKRQTGKMTSVPGMKIKDFFARRSIDTFAFQLFGVATAWFYFPNHLPP